MENDLAIVDLPCAADLVTKFANDHVADVVDALNDYPEETAAEILALLPLERGTDVLDQPNLENPADLVKLLPEGRAAALLEGMSADRRADIFRHLSEPPRGALLARLSPEARTAVEQLLSYPEASAGSIMTTEFVSVLSTATVGQTLHYIRVVERTRETVYAIYVLDSKTKRLIKAVTLRQLIMGDPEASIMSLGPQRKPVVVSPLMDREEVARLISKYDLLALPVVDEKHHMLGIVTVDDIIDAIVDEGTEDAQKFGGMEALDEPYMQIGIVGMLKKRAGWLSVLFVAEMLTAWAMQFFQGELEKAIVLALFIPLVMSSGGNSGSQATSLIIRALALGEIRLRDWWRVALREIPTGAALGAILGVIAIIRIVLWQWLGFFNYGVEWPRLALAIGCSLVGIVTFGSLSGSMLPFIMKRIGFDPASASAPFVATLVDVTGLVIYFSIALVFLNGTLL
ncbi:MAG TPA: magnesium transporter [Devosiaceae bacterium]|jgi:magnesium transporter|nr:magnesium transporter [Devosiaceae bacterium]